MRQLYRHDFQELKQYRYEKKMSEGNRPRHERTEDWAREVANNGGENAHSVVSNQNPSFEGVPLSTLPTVLINEPSWPETCLLP